MKRMRSVLAAVKRALRNRGVTLLIRAAGHAFKIMTRAAVPVIYAVLRGGSIRYAALYTLVRAEKSWPRQLAV